MWLDDTWWIYRAGLGCKQPLARKWGWALAGWSNCIWTQLLGENCRERETERELHCASSTCFSFCGCNHVLQMMWGWWQANFWEGARGGRAFVFASHFCDYVQLQVEVLKKWRYSMFCATSQATNTMADIFGAMIKGLRTGWRARCGLREVNTI